MISQSGLIAFGAPHSALEPLFGRRGRGWIHAFGGKPHDIDDLGLTLLFIETIGAIGNFGNALMAIAYGKLDAGTRAVKLDTFECRDHLVRGGLGAILFGS